jgi:hypothetical protein
VSLDSSTVLLDGSTFTAGTAYFAVFQLTSSGFAPGTQASVSAFDLGTGTGVDQSLIDPVSGNFTVGPNGALPAGIWQTNGTLDLVVDPLNAYALYSQAFFAGTTFAFDFTLSTSLVAGNVPDQFAFQLYDSELSLLYYEVATDASVPLDAPEPGTWCMALLGVAVLRRLRK